jgi:hypothetical protein
MYIMYVQQQQQQQQEKIMLSLFQDSSPFLQKLVVVAHRGFLHDDTVAVIIGKNKEV